jgi:hypothetical protein
MMASSRRNRPDDVEDVKTLQKESVDLLCLRKTEGIRLEMSSGDDNHAKHVTAVTVDAGAWVPVTAGGEGSPLSHR